MSHKRHKRRKPSSSRIVLYSIPYPGPELPEEGNRLLEKALADGVITQWDDGRGHPWWEGPPGPAMRALTKSLRAMVAHAA